MDKAERDTQYAKRLLIHYFLLSSEGRSHDFDRDCFAEIESIVDCIIAAAVAEVKKELGGERDPSRAD